MKSLLTIALVLVSVVASAQITEEMSQLLMRQRNLSVEFVILEKKSSARSPAENERLALLQKQLDELHKRIEELKRQTP